MVELWENSGGISYWYLREIWRISWGNIGEYSRKYLTLTLNSLRNLSGNSSGTPEGILGESLEGFLWELTGNISGGIPLRGITWWNLGESRESFSGNLWNPMRNLSVESWENPEGFLGKSAGELEIFWGNLQRIPWGTLRGIFFFFFLNHRGFLGESLGGILGGILVESPLGKFISGILGNSLEEFLSGILENSLVNIPDITKPVSEGIPW